MDPKTAQELVNQAIEAREKAYAPYSKFKVGAAILTKNGTVFLGCNIENASYGATICAERSAVCNMIANGGADPIVIAICYNEEEFAVPCGICRQVLSEFSPKGDLVILMAKTDGSYQETALSALLPSSFKLN
ncbi:cytidine deaminase [bacterium]|nr:cytidine deaminase [bacterium]